jgi:hypothetical protein
LLKLHCSRDIRIPEKYPWSHGTRIEGHVLGRAKRLRERAKKITSSFVIFYSPSGPGLEI